MLKFNKRKLKSSDNMVEVCVRASLEASQAKELLRFFSMESQSVTKMYINDEYFCRTSVSHFQQVAMSKEGALSLKLSKHLVDGKERNFLTSRIADDVALDFESRANVTLVQNYDQMKRILKNIGFKKFVKLVKVRYQFDCEAMRVHIEEIEGSDTVIEVFEKVSCSEVTRKKKQLKKFLYELGISKSQMMEKDIAHNIMRVKSKF